jgi:hypothetical protein
LFSTDHQIIKERMPELKNYLIESETHLTDKEYLFASKRFNVKYHLVYHNKKTGKKFAITKDLLKSFLEKGSLTYENKNYSTNDLVSNIENPFFFPGSEFEFILNDFFLRELLNVDNLEFLGMTGTLSKGKQSYLKKICPNLIYEQLLEDNKTSRKKIKKLFVLTLNDFSIKDFTLETILEAVSKNKKKNVVFNGISFNTFMTNTNKIIEKIKRTKNK